METSYTNLESVSINSELKNLIIVEELINVMCQDAEVDQDHYGNYLIAVTEAVNNAIIHGNLEDKEKQVKIDIQKGSDEIRFIVCDQGVGFSFDNLPDPTAPENIEKESGRGIFLMKSLSDNVEFEEKGSKVIISFNTAK